MTRPGFALRCILPLYAALVASAAAPQQARLRGREDRWTGCSRGLHYRQALLGTKLACTGT